jgi:hypothetical protein
VADRVVGRVSDRRVRDFVKRKTGAGLGNVARHHMTCPDVFDLDVLAGIKSSTVLDGIQKHLTKRSRIDVITSEGVPSLNYSTVIPYVSITTGIVASLRSGTTVLTSSMVETQFTTWQTI